EPDGPSGPPRLPQDPRLRQPPPARPHRGRRLLRRPRPPARLPERPDELRHRLRDPGPSRLLPPPALAGLRGRGEGREVGPRVPRRPRAGPVVPEGLREPRPRHGAAHPALIALAAQRRRLLPRR